MPSLQKKFDKKQQQRESKFSKATNERFQPHAIVWKK